MYQKIIVIGNLGRDPEMRFTASGQAVTNFNLASNTKYTASDGQLVEETTWFRVSVWGKMAEACNQYLGKGSKVLVEGRLKPDPETGRPRVFERQDGTSGSSFEVTALTVKFLSTRAENEAFRTSVSGEQQNSDSDDIPF